MKIGLYNLEPNIVNTAMMQVSTYHKLNNDDVYIYSPLFHDEYDKIYAFSIFDYTDKGYVRDDMITGGTGFDIKSRLPVEITKCEYDWSLYPDCDYSILWFNRGCIRNCPFCVVREKEGYIHSVEPLNLNPNGEYVKVMDNNFFANPNWNDSVDYLLDIGQKIDMQGFDIRIFNEDQGEALSQLKHHKAFKFAWDNPRDNIDDKLESLLDYIKPSNLMCYVLIGYWSSPMEDYRRVVHLWEKYKIHSFVMPYDKFNRYQKDFSRWVNNKIEFKSCTWEECQEKMGRNYGKS